MREKVCGLCTIGWALLVFSGCGGGDGGSGGSWDSGFADDPFYTQPSRKEIRKAEQREREIQAFIEAAHQPSPPASPPNLQEIMDQNRERRQNHPLLNR